MEEAEGSHTGPRVDPTSGLAWGGHPLGSLATPGPAQGSPIARGQAKSRGKLGLPAAFAATYAPPPSPHLTVVVTRLPTSQSPNTGMVKFLIFGFWATCGSAQGSLRVGLEAHGVLEADSGDGVQARGARQRWLPCCTAAPALSKPLLSLNT